jgi:alanine racemase
MKDNLPRRPAWVEVDLGRLTENLRLIREEMSTSLRFLSVVKDQAYGHGAIEVARVALHQGAAGLAVANLDEAAALRQAGISAPILVFGERTTAELPYCVDLNLVCFANDVAMAKELGRLALRKGRQAPVHVEVDTGLSRYGVRWTDAVGTIVAIAQMEGVALAGVMSHFAQSDELDKTFALEQLERFHQVLQELRQRSLSVPCRHMCNSGGYLDLPQAHFDQVRLGILPLGVYPSQVCRRIPGLAPVMTVKARVAVMRQLRPGDVVGYGMHYRADSRRRIAVLPLGYADGYPRLRNRGEVLIHGQRAPIRGGVAMDAFMVDVTDIPQARPGDEVVVMGVQGGEEISAHDLARWAGTVSYDILAGWRARLPRVYVPRESG